MRRFRFRLQSILDLRRHEEDQRRIELGAATTECVRIRREIAARGELRSRVLGSRPAEVAADDVVWRRAAEAYAYRLVVEVGRLEKELADAEAERAAAAERYREAKRKADVLEKLRERRELAHHDEMKREEHNRLDEVSQYIHSKGGV